MISLSVYVSKVSHAFRIVMDCRDEPHDVQKDRDNYEVRVYQGKDRFQATQAAFANEKRKEIRQQIQRFLRPESPHMRETQHADNKTTQ